MDKQTIKMFLEVKDDIEERIRKIAQLVRFGEFDAHSGYLDDYEDRGLEIWTRLEFPRYCGCCGPEFESLRFPIELLWEEDREEKALALYEQRKKEKEKKEVEEKAKKKKDKEQKDKALLAALKEKYENPKNNTKTV
jgi:hypothetical protein